MFKLLSSFWWILLAVGLVWIGPGASREASFPAGLRGAPAAHPIAERFARLVLEKKASVEEIQRRYRLSGVKSLCRQLEGQCPSAAGRDCVRRCFLEPGRQYRLYTVMLLQ